MRMVCDTAVGAPTNRVGLVSDTQVLLAPGAEYGAATMNK